MILTADHLTKDQLIGLAEMKQSDYVVVYLTPDIQTQISVVIPNGYDTTWETDDELQSFSVQIEFPNNFDILKAKEY